MCAVFLSVVELGICLAVILIFSMWKMLHRFWSPPVALSADSSGACCKIVLHRVVLHQEAFHRAVLYWAVLHRAVFHGSVLHRFSLHLASLYRLLLHRASLLWARCNGMALFQMMLYVSGNIRQLFMGRCFIGRLFNCWCCIGCLCIWCRVISTYASALVYL